MTDNESTSNKTTFSMKLELVPIPVADIDRAKDFYVEKIGFNLDHHIQLSDMVQFYQLTPPGSACSILVSTGLEGVSDMEPGSHKGMHLVVPDVVQVREILIGRGVEVSDIVEYPGGIKYAYFNDPDGNNWALQEIPPNLG